MANKGRYARKQPYVPFVEDFEFCLAAVVSVRVSGKASIMARMSDMAGPPQPVAPWLGTGSTDDSLVAWLQVGKLPLTQFFSHSRSNKFFRFYRVVEVSDSSIALNFLSIQFLQVKLPSKRNYIDCSASFLFFSERVNYQIHAYWRNVRLRSMEGTCPVRKVGAKFKVNPSYWLIHSSDSLVHWRAFKENDRALHWPRPHKYVTSGTLNKGTPSGELF